MKFLKILGLALSTSLIACGGVEGSDDAEGEVTYSAAGEYGAVVPTLHAMPNLISTVQLRDAETGVLAGSCTPRMKARILVKNIGAGSSAPSQVKVSGYAENNGLINVPALSPGAVYGVPDIEFYPSLQGCGTWSRAIRVDFPEEISETNETDNLTSMRCSLTPC